MGYPASLVKVMHYQSSNDLWGEIGGFGREYPSFLDYRLHDIQGNCPEEKDYLSLAPTNGAQRLVRVVDIG